MIPLPRFQAVGQVALTIICDAALAVPYHVPESSYLSPVPLSGFYMMIRPMLSAPGTLLALALAMASLSLEFEAGSAAALPGRYRDPICKDFGLCRRFFPLR